MSVDLSLPPELAEALTQAAVVLVTPGTLVAVLLAWGATHGWKTYLQAFRRELTRDRHKWTWYSYAGSVVAGAFTGAGALGLQLLVADYSYGWAGALGGAAAVALLNGALWRLTIALPLPPLRRALTTVTDREFLREERKKSDH